VRIRIIEKLKPFSHTPGAKCYLPGTFIAIEAFPTLIRFASSELHFSVSGPVNDFTLEQDLEKNCVFVFGHAKEGFYRLRLAADSQNIQASVLNAPSSFSLNGASMRRKETLLFPHKDPFFLPPVWERLSLGVSKAQDWDLVLRRFDLREILPVLYGLGQKIPPSPTPPSLTGTGRLLEAGDFDAFCRAAFSHILIPRFFDDEYQGLAPNEPPAGPPSLLLQEAARALRSLFFRQEDSRLFLLPENPFPAGRMTSIQAEGIGQLDLEWGSHAIRRAILRPSISQEIRIALPKGYGRFRLRGAPSGRGRVCETDEPLRIEAGKPLFLDRFHKI